MTSKKAPKTPALDKAHRLEVVLEPGKTAERQCAELAADGADGQRRDPRQLLPLWHSATARPC